MVGHGGHRGLTGVHLVGDGVGQVALHEFTHSPIEGGGKQQALPVRGDGVEDRGDGGQEQLRSRIKK